MWLINSISCVTTLLKTLYVISLNIKHVITFTAVQIVTYAYWLSIYLCIRVLNRDTTALYI